MHLGEDKTLSKVKERFYWPGMQKDVAQWICTCPVCTTPSQYNRTPLKTIVSGFPMQVVAVDIFGPLSESSAGNLYILVAGDYFMKWLEAYAIGCDCDSKAGGPDVLSPPPPPPPEQLHSDQGKQFESAVIQEICNLLGIRKTRTSPYHPQCDGLMEQSNRTLVDMLACHYHS